MDRLISLEPSNLVPIRIRKGQRCYGELTLRNVMYTMPVAFRLQPMDKNHYTVRPQSGIISPLTTVTIQITYESHQHSVVPESFPYCDDSFLLHSVVVPGAAVKKSTSTFDTIPNEWFTSRKKQVFIDSAIKVMFVGSPVLTQLVINGAMDEIRDVLDKSDPAWKAVESADADGRTLLHLAISQHRPDLVQLLLEFEPDVEVPSGSGSTPLEAAAALGETLIVELLLAHRANVERSEPSSWGSIHFAAGGGHLEILKLLLLKNANINALTKDGNSALHIAVEERRRDCARELLTNDARTDIRNSNDGDTPLHIAAALGDDHMIKLLLQKGANKDIRNKVGKTAYDVAAEHGHNRLYDALRLGESLSIAAWKGEVRTMQRLLENGASLNGRDQQGWTALHRASFKGHLDAVRMLIQKGIDINAKDVDGYTALHCAVESGQVEVIELLVKKGAEVESKTKKGVTAIQIAESLNYSGITRILIYGGATKDGSSVKKYGLPPTSLVSFGKGKIKKKNVMNVGNSYERTRTMTAI
ncbi:MSP domain-containing protein [Heracleum sosnowskyi]|uniref:MSP domain-containing protein n=1 Tax=Heracleum sosnowskyi TaxID=360622 RepID=A0AAD8JIX1_9APIA|nr:MSP domain-containing protein [Heracleum sosnowskyi]